jgi:hypothetical protein
VALGGGAADDDGRLAAGARTGGQRAAPRGVGAAAKGRDAANNVACACAGASWRSNAHVFIGTGAFTCSVVRRTASVAVGG